MDITSKTNLYAVIGNPISHSLSPEIHNKIFTESNTPGLYISLKIPSEELKNSIELFRNNLQGFNVTIPHKEAIIPFLDELDEKARIYGAVNTVKVENGKLKGYNTDGYGFIKSLDELNIPYNNKRTLILGAGGAARVIAYEMILKGARVTMGNRNIEKAQMLKSDLEKTTGASIDVINLGEVAQAYDYIINTTPLGMAETVDLMPLGEHVLKGAELVYDIIYNPRETKLLKMANKYKCRTLNGFTMLFYQAIKAQEIWLNHGIKKSVASKVLSTMMEKNL